MEEVGLHSLLPASEYVVHVREGRSGDHLLVLNDFIVGKRRGSQNKETHVILKKAKPNIRGASQMHDAEVYMNHRVQVLSRQISCEQ